MIQILSRRAEYSSGSQRDLGMEGEAFRGVGFGDGVGCQERL